MGYRLEVAEVEPAWTICGGKLYGYLAGSYKGDGIEKLKSWKWLKDKGIINGDEYWGYGCSIDTVVSANEFREFWGLYIRDYEDIKGERIELDEDGRKSLENDKLKLLTWG